MPTEEYLSERRVLRTIFPRGRFREDTDGTCIVKARRRAYAGDHLFIQAKGRLVGVFYVGRPERYLRRLGDRVVEQIRADGEGILHVAWAADLANLLPMFSRQPVTDAMRERGKALAARLAGPCAPKVERGEVGMASASSEVAGVVPGAGNRSLPDSVQSSYTETKEDHA